LPSKEQTAMKPVLRDIHRYWFGELKSRTDGNPEKASMWFSRSDEVDTTIRENFGRYIPEAAKIDWDVDDLSREEQIGLVVLFDQFPRNIYRTSGEAFAYDTKAREIAGELVDRGFERFYLAEQTFIWVPFEHSEDIADQDYALLLAARMAVEAPESHKAARRELLDYSTKHRDIIRKFGRFPHRNQVLGRESTLEELEFLKGGRGY
jgi:uncharacterized protein (DUF924 family)